MKKNHVRIAGKQVEVKSPLFLYLRNKTGCFGPVLETYPLPTILALNKDVDVVPRDGYEYVFYFVVAATQDFGFVEANFWDIEVGTLCDILNIYTELGLPPALREKWTPIERKKRKKKSHKTLGEWKTIEEKIRAATSMESVWNYLEGWTIGEVHDMIQQTQWRGRNKQEIKEMLTVYGSRFDY